MEWKACRRPLPASLFAREACGGEPKVCVGGSKVCIGPTKACGARAGGACRVAGPVQGQGGVHVGSFGIKRGGTAHSARAAGGLRAVV